MKKIYVVNLDTWERIEFNSEFEASEYVRKNCDKIRIVTEIMEYI